MMHRAATHAIVLVKLVYTDRGLWAGDQLISLRENVAGEERRRAWHVTNSVCRRTTSELRLLELHVYCARGGADVSAIANRLKNFTAHCVRILAPFYETVVCK